MLTKVSKCNRINECIAEKRCVWDGNPANKDLRCMFFEQKLKAVQERMQRSEHLPEIKRLDAINSKISKLESAKKKKLNELQSLEDKAKIQFDTKITRLKNQREKILVLVYGKDKGGIV